ncbi:lantibiotic dehydratase [Streptomyces monomycini]|uniref:lantibiotic dehydratase n=1 Tax=Streptomyces monomycini TaxID=371720 RepID=UPI000997A21D|nr:lantibiotic dehydratase [Streptomyces monomycini]
MPDHDLYGSTPDQGRQWLSKVWHTPLPEAISAASPALCQRVCEILDGTVADARRTRRTVRSVAAYLLRWNHRPTPFGVFAGVAPARPAATASVRWGEGYRTVLRPDSGWLSDLITQLEGSTALLARLTVQTNNTGRSRGKRYVVDGMPTGARAPHSAPVELSIRLTQPVAAVLTAAVSPIPYSVLLHRLADQFPTARPDQLTGLVNDLLSKHVLISSLWPPMTSLDTLSYVCGQLDQADAASIPDIAGLAARLAAIHDQIEHPTGPAPWAPDSSLVRSMQALSSVAPVPLLVDTALDCSPDIPEALLSEAAEAAQVMHQLTPYPYGYPQWRAYHQRFLDRYGTQSIVPVAELVADSGLGLPAGFLGCERTRTPHQATDRDTKVLRMLQEVMLDDGRELALTRATIADLTADHAEPLLPVPRAEIAVEIHAPTMAAVQRGDYRLLVTGAPRPGSSMLGRFAHLLPPPAQAALADSYATATPGAIPAQMSFTPRRCRNENVCRTARLLPHAIPLGQHQAPGPDDIPLNDLAVTADARRFYLVRMSTGQHIEPRVLHALEASVQTPPLARFLAEINTALSPAYKAFTFGVAATLPYLPRVRYKRTILAPARWLLSAEELPARSAPMSDWDKALDKWRLRLRVPDHVALVENDQHLPIDFDQQVHRALLRACLNRTRLAELREGTTPRDRAWIGRPHQLLIPLANTAPTSTLPPLPKVSATGRQTTEPPTILYARLFAHPQRYDELLISHLPELLDRFAGLSRWWFRRHRDATRPDADQHLALFLQLPTPDDYGPAAQRVRDWAETLHHRRLAARLEMPTFQPHTGCYGDGPTLMAAHAVFAADSAACLTQIRATTDDTAARQALTAASIVDLAVQFAGGLARAADWLVRTLPREHGVLSRSLTRQCLALADPAHTALLALPGGPEVATAWQIRATALRTYRDALADRCDPLTVLRSLLQEHCIRALPLDTECERSIGRLTRACALHHRERQP